MLNDDEYVQKSSEYEHSLDDSHKKNNGIFYTDLELAKLIVRYLEIDVEAFVIDPCCGTGSFLYAAQTLGCKNLYGADVDGGAVKICKSYVGTKNVRKLDTISAKGQDILKALKVKDRFDYVIGNPPYCTLGKNFVSDSLDYTFWREVKDSGNNLFVAALYRAFELADDEGIISFIVPKNFLHVQCYSYFRRKILHSKSIISIVDIGAYFPYVRGEQVILTLKNKFTVDSTIRIKKLSGNEFIDCCEVAQSFYRDEIILFENTREYGIYTKLESNYMKFSDICTGYVGRGKSEAQDAVSGKDIRKFGFKTRKVPYKGDKVFIQNIYSAESGIIASFAGSELEAGSTVTVFTDGDENMCRYMVGILHSRLCNYYLLKFCFNNSRLTMHTDAKYLKRIPLVRGSEILFSQIVNLVKAIERTEYMSEVWFLMVESLNQLVYKVYNINVDEAEYINDEINRVQSRRWSDEI